MRIHTAFVAVALLIGAGPSDAAAQVPVEFSPGSQVLSREDLRSLLAQYEAVVESPAYSGSIKAAARNSAARIRSRLEHGDFQPGDRIALTVQGEENLPDTIPVESGPQITLPLFGVISLDGVLRSEINSHLTKEIGRYVKDPVVHAEGLMRLSVQGYVGNPGFYVVPADMLISEALMMAGGPGTNANLDDLRIERGSQRLVEGDEMRQALQAGRTLDQLNLQAGDQLFLPEKTGGPWPAIGRYAILVGSVLLLGIRIY